MPSVRFALYHCSLILGSNERVINLNLTLPLSPSAAASSLIISQQPSAVNMAAPPAGPQYKKKKRPGLIELDPVESVIIVRFNLVTVDTTQVGDDGKPLVVESVADAQRMRLKTFNVNSTISKFAEAIQQQSPLIHESKIPLLEDLLTQLQERLRQQAAAGGEDLSATAPSSLAVSKSASASASTGGGGGGGNGNAGVSTQNLRASAPSMVGFRGDKGDDGDGDGMDGAGQAQQTPIGRRPSGRPGSAARTRPTPVPLDMGGKMSPPPANAASMSPDGGVGSSNMHMRMEHPHPPSPVPLSAEEEEAAMQERLIQIETEERVAREQRRQRNTKRAEMQQTSIFQLENERIKVVERRETLRKKKEREKKKEKESASLKRLDSYIEYLYEDDVASKIRGTALILQLVQNPQNLDTFIDNESVLGTLGRVLSEERKKSTELVTNILEIFFCFSSFAQLHPILLSNKIGDTTMKIVELEMKRYDMRREKEEQLRLESNSSHAQRLPDHLLVTTQYLAAGSKPSSGEEKDRLKKLTQFLTNQERLLFVCFYILLNLAEDLNIELKMRNRRIIPLLIQMLKRTGAPHADDRGFLEELHLLIFTFLKKLSIFEENKKEMKENGIVEACAQFLFNHAYGSALALGVGNSHNGNGNGNGGGAGSGHSGTTNSVDFVASCNPELVESLLRLLHNLAFDTDIKRALALSAGGVGGGWIIPKNFGRDKQQSSSHAQPPGQPTPEQIQYVLNLKEQSLGRDATVLLGAYQFNLDKDLNSSNLVVRCVDLLKKPHASVRLSASRVLYNLSSDLHFRPVVERALYPDLSLLAALLLRCPSKLVDKEVVALAVNVTWSGEMIEAFLTNDVLYALIKRVHQTFDPLLIKLVRNLSQYPRAQPAFKKYLHELVGMTLKSPTPDFLVESLAILANLALPDVLYSELCVQHGLLDFILRQLQPGFAEDDIVLECVQLISTLALDPRCAPLLSNTHLVRNLANMLTEKIEDLDLVVHILFALFKLLLHKESREAIMMHPNLTHVLLDLVADPAPEVRQIANMCLDIIMEHDDVWRDKIRSKRFESFNREWLQLVGGNATSGYQQQHHHMGGNDMDGMMSASGGGYGDSSLGESQDDELDMGIGIGMGMGMGMGMGKYPHGSSSAYVGHDMSELGESGSLDDGMGMGRYGESRGQDSMDDSDLSQQ